MLRDDIDTLSYSMDTCKGLEAGVHISLLTYGKERLMQSKETREKVTKRRDPGEAY